MQRVGLAAMDCHPGGNHKLLHLDEPRYASDLAVRGEGSATGDSYPIRHDLWQPGVEVQQLDLRSGPLLAWQGARSCAHRSITRSTERGWGCGGRLAGEPDCLRSGPGARPRGSVPSLWL